MIAKVIAHGATRDQARERLARALDSTIVLGLQTNKAFLAAVLRDEEFATQGATTDFLARRFPRIEAAMPDAPALAIAAALLAANGNYGEWNSWEHESRTRDAGEVRRVRHRIALRGRHLSRSDR
jgi:geranyl-CoA carboxylase alpha subunit